MIWWCKCIKFDYNQLEGEYNRLRLDSATGQTAGNDTKQLFLY